MLEDSRFLTTSHGVGECDACEEYKEPVLYLASVGATISICLDCLPAVMHDMTQTALHIAWLSGGAQADAIGEIEAEGAED